MLTKPSSLLVSRIIKVAGAAGSYLLAAYLGAEFALSPDSEAIILPAGAVALVAALVWGWPGALGVFIGAWYYYLAELNGAGTSAAATALAAGAALAAWVGAWIVRRTSAVLPPESSRQTLLATGGLVLAALITALISVTIGCAFGFSGWHEYWPLVMSVWLSSLAGMLIFTPLLLLVERRYHKQRCSQPLLWVLTGLITGLTLVSFMIIQHVGQQRLMDEQRANLNEMTHLLDDAVDEAVYTLTALRSFYTASDYVEHSEFITFTAPLLYASPAIQGLAWATHVKGDERLAFESEMQQTQGWTADGIYEVDANQQRVPAASRLAYFPVTYVEPFDINKTLAGFDLGSESARLEAILQARDSMQATLSQPIDLLQVSGSQPGILIVQPVYKNDVPTGSLQERRSNLAGLVLGFYRMDALVSATLGDINPHDIELYLYDVEDPKAPKFLAFYPSLTGPQRLPPGGAPAPADLQTGLYQTQTIHAVNRTWLVVARPGTAMGRNQFSSFAWLSLLVGFLIAGGFLLYVDSRQKREAILAHSETSFRALADNALSGIMRMTLDGKLLYVNDALAQMVGFDNPGEMIGRSFAEQTHNAVQADSLIRSLAASEGVRNVDFEINTRNGEVRHTLISAAANDDIVIATVVDITDRIRAENELRQFSRIVEQMADTVVITQTNGAIEYVNPAFEQLTGYSRADVLGKMPRILKSGMHAREFYEHLWTTILGGDVFHAEMINRKKDGELYYENKTITPIRNVDGKITHFVATGKDITESKRMQEALRRREAEYRLVTENTGDVIWILDLTSQRFTYVSPAVEKMRGFTPDEVLSQGLSEVLTPEAQQKINQLLPERLAVFQRDQTAVTYTDEMDQYRKDGSVVETEVSTVFVVNEQGNLQVVGISRDISERKQAARLQETVYRIAEAARTAESLQDLYPQIHAHISSIMHAENFYIALFEEDRAFMRYVYSVDEIDPWIKEPFPVGDGLTAYVLRTGQPLLFRPGERQDIRVIGPLSQVWLGVPLVVRNQTIGAMAIQHYKNAQALTERDLHILEFVSSQVATAIDRKQTEDAIRSVEKRNSALIENAPDGITLLNSEGRFIFGSPSAYRLFGYSPEEMLGRLALAGMHPEDAQRIHLQFVNLLHNPNETFATEYRYLHKDGTYRWVEGSFKNLLADPSVKAVVNNFRDITERKQASEQLQKSQASLQQAQSIARLGNWELELNTGTGFWSQEMFILLECDPALGVPTWPEFMELAHPDDRQALMDAHRQVVETLKPVTVEYRSNPEQRASLSYYQVSLHPALDAQGGLTGVSGTLLDITQLKLAQLELEALNRDLEKRVEERTAEVRQSEATYRALFENANDGIFLISPDGEDLAANPQALQMLGYTAEEYRELTVKDQNATAVAEQRKDALEKFAMVLRGESVPLYERTFIGKHGKRVDVEINLSPVRGPSGEIVMVQSVVRDITERKKAEEALRESRDKLSAANAALEKASRLKDEFLASMSHELRTPLTGVLGLTEVLLLQTYGPMNEKQVKALKNIESSGRHLLELINDILDLSKIEAGKLDLQMGSCQAGDLCQASLQLIKGMAHQKKQNVGFSMNPAAITLRADPRRLKQMLVNLLSNAVKFTPEGGQLGLEVTGLEDEKVVLFQVWDKGIGIQPGEIGKLFKPFVQLDSSLARQHSGTGLGLSLVQRMAELHGGCIQVESTPGEGSRFTIRLPWDEAAEAASESAASGDTDLLKSSLVIEDNLLDAEHVERYLRAIGIEMVHQLEMRGALEKAAVLQPSVILLDLNLPDGFGFDLLVQLKADMRTSHIPVIITSVEERRGDALNLGASGYLVKPFTQPEMRSALEHAAALIPPPDPVLVIGGVQAPLVMLADDNEVILDTLSDFLRTNGFRVVATRSGFELLERAPELHPDIMLIDIQMPGLDGMETMRRLRAHNDQQVAHTPMIAVTALAMTGDRERCLQAGADEYISKPITLSKLVDQINRFLRGRK